MHLLDLYSLSSGSKVGKPQTTLKYFPLTVDKYITLHTTSKETKSYSYWQEVVSLILPILQKEGISIIQIGQKDEQPIHGCINLLGQTSINQTCYILSKTLLHAGADSFPVHVSSSMNKKIVALYSNNYISNVGPYWSRPDEVILLEPKRKNGEKPSFMIQGEKSINTILPEKIAESICKLLNLEFSYPYKTLCIGSNFHNKIVESACDVVVDINRLGINNILVRADYNFNLDILFNQISVSKCAIITNKKIPIEPLINLRPNIIEVLYEIKKDHDPEFIKNLFQAKIPFRLYSKLKDEDLNPIKLSYIDFPSIIFRKDTNPPDILKNRDLKNIHFKTSKFILSNGNIYSSVWCYKNGRNIPSFESVPLPIIDINLEEDLFVDKDNLYFLEKI